MTHYRPPEDVNRLGGCSSSVNICIYQGLDAQTMAAILVMASWFCLHWSHSAPWKDMSATAAKSFSLCPEAGSVLKSAALVFWLALILGFLLWSSTKTVSDGCINSATRMKMSCLAHSSQDIEKIYRRQSMNHTTT